jgi:curli biogenesis system outer membrane secretion channel CsgG
MKTLVSTLAAAAMLATPVVAPAAVTSASGKTNKDGTTKGASSGRRDQERGQRDIPRCTRRLGTVAIVEPDNQWWRELNLGSPEVILKIFVQQSGCFGLVNRGRSMASRNLERAMADSGELQAGSNLGKGQVKAADYFLQPDIVSSNRNSGGNALGGMLGGMLGGRTFGALAGGISIKKSEANVTLSIVNARTTEEEAMTEGYARKSDLSFGAGGGAGWWGGFAAAGGGGYQNTDIGQVIVLAYLDAYTKLVTQLGGLPENAAAAAPTAK